MNGSVCVVCGGVGAAKFLRGLVQVVEPARVQAVANVADDTELHGLHISPDLDTITYTVSGQVNPDTGWGLAGETWATLGALARFAPVRPEGSAAGATWFQLGDKDMATHLYRTARLREGASLTQVTGEIAAAYGLGLALLPATDERLRTMVQLADGAEVDFQTYFVGLRHSVPVSGVRFDGPGIATPTPEVRRAVEQADVVVIAPSNPIVSIGPVVAVIEPLLRAARDRTVAISPIVAGAALKGPADRMLVELGHEASVVGVARLYAPLAATLVIDTADADLADAVEAEGIRAIVTDTIMSTPQRSAALASAVLDAAAR